MNRDEVAELFKTVEGLDEMKAGLLLGMVLRRCVDLFGLDAVESDVCRLFRLLPEYEAIKRDMAKVRPC